MTNQHQTRDNKALRTLRKPLCPLRLKKEQHENNNQLLELLPTKQLRFPTPKRNPKRRTKNPFRQTNRDTTSIQQRP